MKEVTYDAGILQKYADELYRKAWAIIATTALKYGSITFVATLLVSSGVSFLRHSVGSPDPDARGALLFAAIAALVGFAAGRRKAFFLKLEAQRILCQRQIELNTRGNARPESMTAVAGR
jgi:hypothetical protein